MRTGQKPKPKDDWNRLQLNLDEEDMSLLEQQARDEKLSKSEILRRALRYYCSRPAEKFQLVNA